MLLTLEFWNKLQGRWKARLQTISTYIVGFFLRHFEKEESFYKLEGRKGHLIDSSGVMCVYKYIDTNGFPLKQLLKSSHDIDVFPEYGVGKLKRQIIMLRIEVLEEAWSELAHSQLVVTGFNCPKLRLLACLPYQHSVVQCVTWYVYWACVWLFI